MSSVNTEVTRKSPALRRRLGGLGAGTAALAIVLAGVNVPAANALPIEPGTFTFDAEFGTGEVGGAYGVAVDPSTGDFYVTDIVNDKLVKFNRNGVKITERGSAGNGLGNFDGPHGVAVAPDGSVYVADTGNHLIQRFLPDLSFGGQIGLVDQPGNGNGEFNQPLDVAVDGEGNIFVADTSNNRVQKFSKDHTWADKWGVAGQGDQQFTLPRGVTVTETGAVLVADSGNDRISAWSNKGVHAGNFGSPGNAPGKFDTPADIAVDKAGNIFVADIGNDRVQQLNGAGAPMREWSTPASAQGIALDTTLGRTYVANGSNAILSYRQATVPKITVGPKTWADAGKWYSSTLKATGYPDVSWSISAGALPTGLKLAGGKVYGTPTKPGTYQVTLRADNGVTVLPPVTQSYTIKIYKSASRVSAKFSTKYPRVARTNTRATIRLSAPYTTGLSKTGKVRVYYGKKRVKTYTVKSAKGSLTVRLPKFTKKGKTRVTLRYLGNSQLKSAKRTIYVRVR